MLKPQCETIHTSSTRPSSAKLGLCLELEDRYGIDGGLRRYVPPPTFITASRANMKVSDRWTEEYILDCCRWLAAMLALAGVPPESEAVASGALGLLALQVHGGAVVGRSPDHWRHDLTRALLAQGLIGPKPGDTGERVLAASEQAQFVIHAEKLQAMYAGARAAVGQLFG
jgi:hypothetical protein